MTDLQVNLILIINGLTEEGAPPTRQEIKAAIGAQVDRAMNRLVKDRLVEVAYRSWGYQNSNPRFKLADKVPTVV